MATFKIYVFNSTNEFTPENQKRNEYVAFIKPFPPLEKARGGTPVIFYQTPPLCNNESAKIEISFDVRAFVGTTKIDDHEGKVIPGSSIGMRRHLPVTLASTGRDGKLKVGTSLAVSLKPSPGGLTPSIEVDSPKIPMTVGSFVIMPTQQVIDSKKVVYGVARQVGHHVVPVQVLTPWDSPDDVVRIADVICIARRDHRAHCGDKLVNEEEFTHMTYVKLDPSKRGVRVYDYGIAKEPSWKEEYF